MPNKIQTRTLQSLEPHIVWAQFATLCAIPHPSLREAALRDHLVAWAEARGIAARTDAAGNLILKKTASPGCEHLPGVVLQGHLDMVCQANAGTQHDFARDPIRPVVREGWVAAEQTTLGADNGIGVALALAALEAQDFAHPPLEVLLTVNEESGMDGARELAPGTLQGRTLINLDTEEWGHFYLGCAGGVDVQVRRACALAPLPADYAAVRFDVGGLQGGHSGMDIHLGRGNAIKLLAEALHDLAVHCDLRLVELDGGTARNAIPREAYAVCMLPATIAATIDTWQQHRLEAWRARYAESDAGITFICSHPEFQPAHALAAGERAFDFLDVALNGVAQMSEDFPGVVDTSSNLGIARLLDGFFSVTFKVRSLNDARAGALADKLVSFAKSYGLEAWKDGAYPGWTPNPDSAVLSLCQHVYIEEFGQPANLQVVHAGLECGLLAASHPQLDMISFGPDIRGAHAPGERVEIASVARCWKLLKAVLQAMTQKA